MNATIKLEDLPDFLEQNNLMIAGPFRLVKEGGRQVPYLPVKKRPLPPLAVEPEPEGESADQD